MKKTSDHTKQKVDERITVLMQQGEEWKTKYMRALADYQNLEKRTEDRVQEVRQYAGEIILSRILPVVDTFSKVREHVKDPGLELAYKELLAVLTEQGVEQIETKGRQFDPKEMDCVEVVSGNDSEVVEEVLSGYRLRDKVLRVARVKVGASEPTYN